MPVCPLVFEPILKPKVWGGRRLEPLLHKRLPPGEAIGESWEISDLPGAESRVARGPAEGKSIRELVREWGDDLVGNAPLVDGRFPLLIKFLDAREPLSVQVHPDVATAQMQGGDVQLKNEAWYVIDAEPDAVIYRGVKDGVTGRDFRAALASASVELLLQKVPARRGHAYYLCSGTVHALGGGVLVAEVQTPSDTTYRLFDWGRSDRELHVEQALACASFGPVATVHERPQHVASVWTSVTSVIRCESFVIERVRMVEGVEQAFGYDEMVIWMVLEGRGRILAGGLAEPFAFSTGDTVLLPAGLKNGRVLTETGCLWLEVSIPIASSLAGFDRPSPETVQPPKAPGLVDLRLPRRE